ncbi:hypothetical protein BO70DRAFT_361051 [Aspergillus heteromorphus CBS 117.55]|uniref:Uncharacterized protein n=1 Tax=Aspergillus heteromorphus CBS 117.55 TaxID=1448321 RepID=A0A317WID6_9EURO|nr:uncharacterized protein BO70DRAFT_361051 [Aspergillus heteromorphus CBS 117.55]PWY86226.1 hypothetical protein BO70DRAFT_361051 [Aspergillus heteromorphus CBS 117.55]
MLPAPRYGAASHPIPMIPSHPTPFHLSPPSRAHMHTAPRCTALHRTTLGRASRQIRGQRAFRLDATAEIGRTTYLHT